jgi:hypothetical protein
MGQGLNNQRVLSPIVSEAVDIRGRQQASVAFNGTAAVSNTLVEGIYDLWATADCYLAVSNSNAVANAVASNTGYLLRAGNTVPFRIRPGDIIGVIQASASGTLAFVQVG